MVEGTSLLTRQAATLQGFESLSFRKCGCGKTAIHELVSRMAREKPIGKTGINDVKEDASVVGRKASGS